MEKERLSAIRIAVVLLVALIFIGFTALPSRSQDFPTKPVTIIVPHSPGGGGDIAARMLASNMEKHLGVPVVVNNIPGAGSMSGMITLFRSKPDGYTIGMNYAQMVCGGQIFEKNTPYDVNKFTVIGQFVTVKYTVGVPKDSPYRSIKDFKTAQKPVRFCGIHYTANESVTAVLLAKELGFPISLVTGYGGAAPCIVGSMKGECDAVDFGSALLSYYKRGDMVPLLSLTSEPSEDFPGIPNLKDLGLPEYLEHISNLNYVLWAPPGVPEAVVKKLQEAMIKSTGELKDKFRERLLVAQPLGGAETKKIVSKVYETFLKHKGTVEQYSTKH